MIAFPLRFRDSFLAQCDEPEALVALFRVMANTPHGSWEGSPHFGLRGLLDQSRSRPDRAKFAVGEINQALQELGITTVKVEGIACDAGASQDVKWTVTLSSTADRDKTYSLDWTGSSG